MATDEENREALVAMILCGVIGAAALGVCLVAGCPDVPDETQTPVVVEVETESPEPTQVPPGEHSLLIESECEQ